MSNFRGVVPVARVKKDEGAPGRPLAPPGTPSSRVEPAVEPWQFPLPGVNQPIRIADA